MGLKIKYIAVKNTGIFSEITDKYKIIRLTLNGKKKSKKSTKSGSKKTRFFVFIFVSEKRNVSRIIKKARKRNK